MDLARAFTKRSKRPEGLYGGPTRMLSTRKQDGSVNHNAISSPLELLSATNALAYDAPSLHQASDSDSPMSSLPSSRDTTPDSSSIECLPSPLEDNHLTDFFRNPGAPLSPKSSVRRSTSSAGGENSSFATRMRSQLRKSQSNTSTDRDAALPIPIMPKASQSRDSAEMSSQKNLSNDLHPFGAELAQVDELAEEIGGRDVIDQDEHYLVGRGLHQWTADDYMNDIIAFFEDSSMNPYGSPSSPWI